MRSMVLIVVPGLVGGCNRPLPAALAPHPGPPGLRWDHDSMAGLDEPPAGTR